MRLNNLRFPGQEDAKDLLIGNGKITAILPAAGGSPAPWDDPARLAASSPAIDFDGALAFPGLINSHDHLDFNLFPALGNRIYENYTAWGKDIHLKNTATIKSILKIPRELRTLWGIYKNLLNGFTTVVNHGEKLPIGNDLITVFQDYHYLHSVELERNWQWKLNRPGIARQPFVIHIGEGTDKAAAAEIDRLIRWNIFSRPLVGIHAVAMNERQAKAFRALVWCPASNFFLLDETAPVDRLKHATPIIFGTDSTLTAEWNSWNQLRLARKARSVTDLELLDMLTKTPARTWGLMDRGTLAAGLMADLVVARPKPGMKGMDAFYELDPEDLLLVFHEGKIRLFDPSLLKLIQTQGLSTSDFHQTTTGGKYVSGNLPGLMQEIRHYCPDVQLPVMP